MRFDRTVVAAALLLASGGLHAYQIIEGRYRVEVAPGKYEDQLVVRCDDGRTLIVRWETKLAEACGEGLMGGPAPKAARAQPSGGAPKAAQTAPANPAPKAGLPPQPDAAATGDAPDSAAPGDAPSGLFDEQSQKEAMLAQVRAQFGNVPERYIEFKPGADGLSMRFLPPLSEILKKYETCRKAREARADCAAERDGAIAKLSETTPPAAVRNEKAPASARPVAAADTSAPQSGSTELPSIPAQADAKSPAAIAPDRAAAEQKIGEDYTWCMRAKPKFECDQARAKALSALDKPKPAPKPKRPAKQAAIAPNVAAAR